MAYDHLISPQQAKIFLREKLGMEVTDESLQQRGLTLLNNIIERYHTIPFQNLTMMAKAPATPSFSEGVDAVLTTGVGGLCLTMNSILYILLKALGYKVYPVSVGVNKPELANHLVVIAENVDRPGDRFLVEAGFMQPTFQAIPLDFGWESPVYDQSFMSFKYRLEGDTYIRMVKTSRFPEEGVRRVRIEDGWAFSYYFKLKPSDLNTIMQTIGDQVYQNDESIFWNSLRMIRWEDNRAICIKDFQLLLENDSGKLESVSTMSEDTLPEMVLKYFPKLDEASVKAAVKKFVSILNSPKE